MGLREMAEEAGYDYENCSISRWAVGEIESLRSRLAAAEQEKAEAVKAWEDLTCVSERNLEATQRAREERAALHAKLLLAANPEYADNVCRDHCSEVATLKAENEGLAGLNALYVEQNEANAEDNKKLREAGHRQFERIEDLQRENERLAAKVADMQDDDQLTANTLIDLNRQLTAAQQSVKEQFGAGEKEGAMMLACYLLDHYEGETITEERLQQWCSDAIREAAKEGKDAK